LLFFAANYQPATYQSPQEARGRRRFGGKKNSQGWLFRAAFRCFVKKCYLPFILMAANDTTIINFVNLITHF
jgi:hypothetical protein